MIKDILAAGGFIGAETSVIPILSAEDEKRLFAEEMPEEVALLPMRNTVLFPGMVIHLLTHIQGMRRPERHGRKCAAVKCCPFSQGSKTVQT